MSLTKREGHALGYFDIPSDEDPSDPFLFYDEWLDELDRQSAPVAVAPCGVCEAFDCPHVEDTEASLRGGSDNEIIPTDNDKSSHLN
jgi:hypothetical protein